jgi:hypothetical protein
MLISKVADHMLRHIAGTQVAENHAFRAQEAAIAPLLHIEACTPLLSYDQESTEK